MVSKEKTIEGIQRIGFKLFTARQRRGESCFHSCLSVHPGCGGSTGFRVQGLSPPPVHVPPDMLKLVPLLPPTNDVCEGYVFTGVDLSTGGVPGQVHPGRYTPWAGTPSGRYAPSPRAGTPPGQVRPRVVPLLQRQIPRKLLHFKK